MLNNKRIIAASLILCLAVLVPAGIVYSQVNGFIPTKLTTSDVTVTGNGPYTVTARLTTFFTGRPVAGVQITPYIVYEYSSVPLGPTYTDSNGVARLTRNYDAIPPGTRRYIGWSFAGNGYYGAPIPISTVTSRR
ncbi:MAG: hypothetical protein ACREEM_00585 [Blastocatellia bacterium]